MNNIGILDPDGKNFNPLNNKQYSENYTILSQYWKKLPAYESAVDIIKNINDNQLLIVISGTGSGKTVLIPKFALHQTNYDGKIGITLPKRKVTLSAAEFAAKTLDVDIGKEVGYVYKGSPKNMVNDDNKLLYMTDGSLVAKLIKDPLLNEFKIIIIDEAHERKIQIDLLFLLLKRVMENRPDFKLIIMSATVEPSIFTNYFSTIKSKKVINISGKPNYPIKSIFLDTPTNNYIKSGLELIDMIISSKIVGDILFFITLSSETYQVCRKIREKYPKIFCIEVYADAPTANEELLKDKNKYHELGNYDRRLILATNVAESSLTIDGLKIVIDSGYELHGFYDPDRMAHILEKRLITQDRAIQRIGRVGRTEPGMCYHLYTEQEFNNMRKSSEPDILEKNIVMESLMLLTLPTIKTIPKLINLMEQLIDSPKSNYVNTSIRLLKEYKLIDDNEKITNLGIRVSHFNSLELNMALGLIISYENYCAKEFCDMLGIIESIGFKIKNLFSLPSAESNQKMSKKIGNLLNKSSDHLTLYNIISTYKSKEKDRSKWCNKYNFDERKLIKAIKKAKEYYGKLIRVMQYSESTDVTKIELELERTNNNSDVSIRKLTNVLKLSHKHNIGKNMRSLYPSIQQYASVSNDSFVKINKDISFIYDELVSMNGKWEFNLITII
jgi:pre-mRNA-splicing factor ATP-dependent RNA helicase DHX15/PRP43